jgi:hypothetical protein
MRVAGQTCLDVFRRRFWPSTVAPGDPYLNYRETGYWSEERTGSKEPLSVIVVCICLRFTMSYLQSQFPCLALTTVGQQTANRIAYEGLRDTLTTAPPGGYSSDCIVHLERTLDEAYFPGLGTAELTLRNADQVVSSHFRTTPDWKEDDVPILMVPQLWLWRFGNLIVSAHNMTPGSDSSLFKRWRDQTSLGRFEQPFVDVQLGLIIANFIQGFGKEHVDHSGRTIPPTLDLFERRVVSVLSEVKTYITETKRNAIDYNSETNFLHVLSDCRSELAMIQHILEQQEEILISLLNDRDDTNSAKPAATQDLPQTVSKDPCGDETSDGDPSDCVPPPPSTEAPHESKEPDRKRQEPHWSPVEAAHTMLKQYQKRIKKIDGDAERVEKNVQDLLNLKRIYASVQDSHAGVLLSVAAIGFAIVTVIFAPLAFLVGLFALNLQGFDRLRVRQGNGEQGPGGACGALSGNIGSNNGPVFDSVKLVGIFSKSIYFHFTALQVRMTLILSSRHRDYHHSRNVFARMDIATMVRDRLHRFSHGARGEAGKETKEKNEEGQSESREEGR